MPPTAAPMPHVPGPLKKQSYLRCCISASNRQLRHRRKRERTFAVCRLRTAERVYEVCCRQGFCAPSL